MSSQPDIKDIDNQYEKCNTIAFICKNSKYSRNLATDIISNKNEKILIMAPTVAIIEEYITFLQNKGISLDNIEFKTYDEVINYSVLQLHTINPSLIILDEFNNIGGSVWNNIFNFIKMNNPNVKILGLAPTTIKAKGSLNELDLTEEGQLFENAIIHNYSLEQMILDNILKCDGYVSINGNLPERLEFLQSSIDKYNLPSGLCDELREKLNDISNKITEQIDYSDIIKRYISTNGKYLIICNDEKDLLKTKTFIDGCISDLIKTQSFVSLFNLGEISQEQIASFNGMNFDGIKIMYAINKYNENLNLKNLDGCFLSLGYRSIDTFKNDVVSMLHMLPSKIIYDLGNNIDYIKEIDSEISKNGKNKINTFVNGIETQVELENISRELNNRTDEFYQRKNELVELILKNETPKLSYRFKDGMGLRAWLKPGNPSHEKIIQESILGDEYSTLIVNTYNLKTIELSFEQKIDQIYNHIIEGKPIELREKFSNGQYYRVFLNVNRDKLLKLSASNTKIDLIVKTFNIGKEISDDDKKIELAEELRENGKSKTTADVRFSDGTLMYDWQKRKVIREKLKAEAMSGDEDAKLILKTYVKLTFDERVLELVQKIDNKEEIQKGKTSFSDGVVIFPGWTRRVHQQLINASLKGNENCKTIVKYFDLDKKVLTTDLSWEQYLLEIFNKLKYCYENNKDFTNSMKFSNGVKMKKWLEDNRDKIREDSEFNETCKGIIDYEHKIVNEDEILKGEFLGYIRQNGIERISSLVKFSNGKQMNKWWNSYQHKIFASNDSVSKEITKIYNSVIRLTTEQKTAELVEKIRNGEKINDKTLFSNGQPAKRYYYIRCPRFKYYAVVKKDPNSIILVDYFEENAKHFKSEEEYLEQFNNEKQEIIGMIEKNNINILKEKLSNGKEVWKWLRRHKYRLVMEEDSICMRIAEELVIPNFKDADGEDLIMIHKQDK